MESAGKVEFTQRIQGGTSFRFKQKQDGNTFSKSCIGKLTIWEGGGGRGQGGEVFFGFFFFSKIRISLFGSFQKAEFHNEAESFPHAIS